MFFFLKSKRNFSSPIKISSQCNFILYSFIFDCFTYNSVWIKYKVNLFSQINHFTVVCSVTWPFNGSEAQRDLVLIQLSLFCCVNQVVVKPSSLHLHEKSREVYTVVKHGRRMRKRQNCRKYEPLALQFLLFFYDRQFIITWIRPFKLHRVVQ